MSLRFMDGFESYGTSGAPTSHFGERYTWYATPGGSQAAYYQNLAITTGRYAGFAITDGAASQPSYFRIQKDGPFANGAVVVGFNCQVAHTRKFFTLIELAVQDDFTFVDAENFNLRTTADGNVAVYFQNTLLNTTTGIDLNSGWHYVEFRAVCHASTGAYELWIDNTSKLSASGLDSQVYTDPGYFIEGRYEALEWGNHTDNDLQAKFDDMYAILEDSSGYNDSRLTPRFIEAIKPMLDGGFSDFTPSTGTDHFSLVDENPPNSDTDYVEAANASAKKDLWRYTNLALIPGSGTVEGVTVYTTAKDTASSAFYRTVWKQNGVEANNSAPTLDTSYSQHWELVAKSPNGPTAWTVNRVNDAQFGVKEDG